MRKIPGPKGSSPRRLMRTFGKPRSSDHDREIPIFSEVTTSIVRMSISTCDSRVPLRDVGSETIVYAAPEAWVLKCLALTGRSWDGCSHGTAFPCFEYLSLATGGEIRYQIAKDG